MKTEGMTRDTKDKAMTIRHQCAGTPILMTLEAGARVAPGDPLAVKREVRCSGCGKLVVMQIRSGS